ncbi:prepilin-type N-terminal cleavage/methylation domain-containing protein [Burkholderia cenocepacia]
MVIHTAYRCVRISVMVISRFGERDQFGRWCCAVNGL